jgi:alkaline phosphatase D
MLHLGDFHYSDIGKNNPVLFRVRGSACLAPRHRAPFTGKCRSSRSWDDHDFGGNNSTSDSPSREAARRVYQEFAAHYPLPAGAGDVPIYQAFTVGRVRFILTDLRSERSSTREKDPAMKTTMGAAQKAWFKQELLAAKVSGAGLIIWGSSVPYIGRAGRGDSWGFFDLERRELADFIKANAIDNLLILCGDAHMCAVDDGSNAAYATNGGGAPLAVLHGSSLDRSSSFKGGPYSHGWYLPKRNEGCFGWVEVLDDGANIRVDFSARNQRDVVRMQFSVEV